jgi:hypothetical protein
VAKSTDNPRRPHSGYARSAKGSWRDRLPLAHKGFVNIVDLNLGLKTKGFIGSIRQVPMCWVIVWVYRGIEHWVMRVSRAPIPLLHLARWDSYVNMLGNRWNTRAPPVTRLSALTAAASCPWIPMEPAVPPLPTTTLLSALTAASCRP